MNSESPADNTQSKFWEDTYLEALDEKSEFLGKYEKHCRSYPKEGVLGKGGVKTVYKSFDWKTEREIALAVQSEQCDENMSMEFIHEAIILGKLEHPNIIPVYDTGLDEDKKPYFTMKLVRGKDLRVFIDEKSKSTVAAGELPELLEIFKKVCQAVSYAHSKNILHLDIKPGNILIGQFGEVFLCDWGLSEQTDGLKKDIDGTYIKGTPGFMAPELLENKSSDSKMDIYSLGCLLYFILCRKAPVQGDGKTEFFMELIKNEMPPLEKECPFPVPQSLVQIFEKCCRHKPGERYSNANDIIEDLDLYTKGFATKAEEAGLLRNLQLLYKRNHVKINIILIFTLLFSGLTAFYVIKLKESARVAIAEKDKAQDLTRQLLKKQEEDRKFIQETLNTVDSTFSKGRSDSTRRFLENSLMIDPDNEETMYKLAQVKIVNGRWEKVNELLNKVKSFEREKVDKLKALSAKFEKLPDSSDTKYSLSIEAFKMGFHEMYFNLSEDLLSETSQLSLKAKYIKAYLELENSLENLDFSYDETNAELVIKNASLNKLRTLKHIHINILRLLNCEVSGSISNTIPMKILDLRDSKVSLLNELKLKSVEILYMPLNRTNVKFQYAGFLKTVYLPKKVYKRSSLRDFSGEVMFY